MLKNNAVILKRSNRRT